MVEAETYVTLRITKPGMSAGEVTARLGIEPTYAFEDGDPRVHGAPHRHAMWSLSTKSQCRGGLQDHLGTLLDVIEPKREVLVEMSADGFDMDWFCFVSVDGNGGLVLQVDLLQRPAALPIVLSFDIYG